MFGQKQDLTQIEVHNKQRRNNKNRFSLEKVSKRTKSGLADNLSSNNIKEHIRNKISLTDKIQEINQNETKLSPQLSKPRYRSQKKNSKVQLRSKQQTQIQKTIRLKELYNKKTELLQKLKILNRQARIKTMPNTSQSKALTASTVHLKKNKPSPLLDSNSRYRHFLKGHQVSSLCKEKLNSHIIQPESDNSLQKDRKILDFIRKAHKQTIKREANRLQNFHKLLRSQIQSEIQLKSSKINKSSHFSSYIA